MMGKHLLSILAATALTAVGVSAASAADLPARAAPPPAPFVAAPVFTWSGFYVGVNAGYGWADDNNNNSVFVPAGTFVGFPGASGTITYGDDSGDGFVGGGQIGYNYQFGSVVVGVEADIQWADMGADRNGAVLSGTFPRSFVAAGRAGGIDWFGTVRGRLGFAFDRALIYATGGFAYGGGDTDNDFDGLLNDGNDDDVRTGWVIGVGAEYAFTDNLTAGIEGLWVNLESDNDGTFIGSYVPAGGGARRAAFAAGADREDDADFFVARARLNFKFGTF